MSLLNNNNPMANTNPIIIECSARDCLPKSLGKQNSEWANDTTYPITLKEGDSVVLKNIFLDTGGSDIKFDDDTVISGQIGYYDVNNIWGDAIKTGYEGLAGADFKYYLAWDNETTTATLVSFRVNFIQPENCGFLQPLPFQVSFIYDTPTVQNLSWKMSKHVNLKCDNFPYQIDLVQWGGEIPNVLVGSIRDIKTDSNFCSVEPNSFIYADPVESIHLLTNTFSFVLKAGSYTRDQLAKTISDNLSSINEIIDGTELTSSNPFLFRTDDNKWLDDRLRFYKTGFHPNDIIPPEYYTYLTAGNALSKYWMGSSQVSLIWDADANHFSWTFLHTPISNANEIGIAIYNTQGPDTSTVLHQCGTFFMDLQPREFWSNVLNFDLDTLLVTYDVNPGTATETISDAQLRSKITKGLLSMQSLFPNFNRSIIAAADPILISTDETVQLKGQNIAGLSDTFYLVEINIGNETFTYKGNMNNEIRAILGSYYETSNWVQGYSSDSILYQHTGSPQILSRLRIRILDPNTKEPVTTLGSNSFVYVMVVPSGGNAS